MVPEETGLVLHTQQVALVWGRYAVNIGGGEDGKKGRPSWIARRERMKPLSLLIAFFLTLLLACLTLQVAFSADASEGTHTLMPFVIISLL